MPSITLSYGSGGATSRTFSALSVKGFKPGDLHEVFPKLRPEYRDGSIRKKQQGFRRKFEIEFAPTQDGDDMEFLGAFLNNTFQYLTFTYELAYTRGSSVEGELTVTTGTVNATTVDLQFSTNHDSWTAGDTVYLNNITTLSPAPTSGLWVITSIPAVNQIRITHTCTGTVDGGTAERTINSITETNLQVVDDHPEFSSDWGPIELDRSFSLRLTEADPRTSYPT